MSALTPCPLCGARPTNPHVILEDAPAHTVVLCFDKETARSAPKGTIQLCACPSCSFVYNASFQPDLLHYVSNYEATQAASKTFRAFQKGLAQRVLAATGNRLGPILEVGCGQGEFLAELEQISGRAHIGFDPAFDTKRSALPAGSGTMIHAEPFSKALLSQTIAAVVCLMTLEHVADPLPMLADIAATSAANDQCPVFVMVPNAHDILKRQAFWDVYYEHCNYFTPTTLLAAMSRVGIETAVFEEAYDGQYLLATAHVSSEKLDQTKDTGRNPISHDLLAFEEFCASLASRQSNWRAVMQNLAAENARLVLWGGGSKAVGCVSFLGEADRIAGVFDINVRKWNTALPGSGLPILSERELIELDPTHIVIMNRMYQTEIANHCQTLGLSAQLASIDDWDETVGMFQSIESILQNGDGHSRLSPSHERF